MTSEEKLKIRIEIIVADPKKSRQVLHEIEQYLGRVLMDANNIKNNGSA
jgi:hypothetical protein